MEQCLYEILYEIQFVIQQASANKDFLALPHKIGRDQNTSLTN